MSEKTDREVQEWIARHPEVPLDGRGRIIFQPRQKRLVIKAEAAALSPSAWFIDEFGCLSRRQGSGA